MLQHSQLILASAALMFAASCAPKAPPREMVETGPGVSCVNINQIRNTNVVDDQTIDFHMNGGQVMRNTLPSRCPGLGSERAFSYRTSLSRLCSVDTITVIHSGGGPRRGATCGLGQFTPVQAVQTAPETLAAPPAPEADRAPQE